MLGRGIQIVDVRCTATFRFYARILRVEPAEFPRTSVITLLGLHFIPQSHSLEIPWRKTRVCQADQAKHESLGANPRSWLMHQYQHYIFSTMEQCVSTSLASATATIPYSLPLPTDENHADVDQEQNRATLYSSTSRRGSTLPSKGGSTPREQTPNSFVFPAQGGR